ncbi:hypothetical protein ACFL1E_00575 [Candidatus Omnitrophota bacterium]
MVEENIKQEKTATLPQIWVGYVAGVVLFLLEAIATVMIASAALSEESSIPLLDIPYVLISLGAFIYWLVCVYKIHKVLFQATDNTYPITPRRAVGFHFLPFYNLYWIFKWPSEVVKFINVNAPSLNMKPYAPGAIIAISFLLNRAIPSIGTIVIFISLKWMIRNIKKVLEENPPSSAPVS